MQPIGIIHSPFTDKTQTPIQPSRSPAIGQVEVYPEFAEGLQDVEGFSHLFLLYVFHCSLDYTLRVKPFLDDQQRDLFATCYPARPNPIGLSVVRLSAGPARSSARNRRRGRAGRYAAIGHQTLRPDFDARTDVRTDWYTTRSKA